VTRQHDARVALGDASLPEDLVRRLPLRLLLVLALAAPAVTLAPRSAEAGGAPSDGGHPVVSAADASTGEWVTIDPVAAWGGVGTRLAAGESRDITVQTGRAVPAAAQALVVQVRTSDAAAPGTLALGPLGSAGDGVVSFDVGSGAATTIVAVGADRRASVQVTADVRVSLDVIGFVRAVGEAPPAGATVAVRPALAVDSATGVGGTVPAPAGTATVPLAGVAGLPDTGVAGVWLSVQTHGVGTGSVRFPQGGAAADAAPVTARWASTLVLAPLSPDLDLTYTPTGAGVDALRITVVGWLADATHGTADTGALVAAPAVTVPVGPSVLGLQRLDLTRGAVPAGASSVVLRATVTTGAVPGELRTATSAVWLLLRPDTAAPLPSRTTSTVTTVVPLSRTGDAFVAVPADARLTSISVLGFRSAAVPADVDRDVPVVEITSPGVGAHVSQLDDPVITLAGTASDADSGVRSVAVTADGADLGAATLRTTASGETTWSLDVTPPSGDHTVQVTATDWAGRTSTATGLFTVDGVSEDETVVAPEVQVLDGSAAVLEVQPDHLVLDGASDIRAGDVVVSDVTASTPDGLLRRVTIVERVAGTTVLHTTTASLTDLFLQADIRAEDVPLTGETVQVDPTTGEVVAARAARGALEHTFTLSGSAKSGPVTAKVTSAITVSVTLTIDIDVDWGWAGAVPRLQEFQMLFGTDTSSTITGTFTTSGTREVEIPLGEVTLGRIFFAIGPVPVVLTPNLDPSFVMKAGVSQSSTVTLGLETTLTTGVVYRDSEWEPVSDSDTDGSLDGNVQVSGTLSAGLRLPLGVKLYEVAGPYASVDLGPELSLTADAAEESTTAKLDFVLGVSVGAEVEVLSRSLVDVSYDLDLARTTLWTRTWPWSGGSGFGLADVGLDVCLPAYTESTRNDTASRVGTDASGDPVFRVDPGAAALLADDTQYIRHLIVVLQIPGSSPDDDVAVTWSHDPDGWYGQNWPEIYTERARSVAATDGPGMWEVEFASTPLQSAMDGYTDFTVDAAGAVVSAWTEITVREYPSEDQGLCAYRSGTRVADGLPAEDGLHWDAWRHGAVQFSLENSHVPTGTASVQLVCTDDGSGYWPHDLDYPMQLQDSYERWTDRFETTERAAPVWIGTSYLSGAGILTCRADAYSEAGRLLETFPLVGGPLDAPWRDVVPT
jgi:hypothetical protein